jgi:hypothetical protein
MNTTWNLKEIERNKRLYEIGGFSGSGVGSLGALIMTFSALFHMILISRDRKYEAGQYTYQVEMGKTPIMAPMGYNQKAENKIKYLYKLQFHYQFLMSPNSNKIQFYLSCFVTSFACIV